ncbi:hypothetical protein PVAP13_3NG031700 [Panicum virgatum]|uniref:Pectin acetylesterase n=1 Tax=Panicum virgatum TaxID=38727 RepID=A0A8T0U2R5_PANVG|nr:hypothetical protein PVAP13_3NG031700 [Panicum virgatum]KAG2615115.1 hypothetical protein PVAP13_3NG031700 [Panicum virgatum]
MNVASPLLADDAVPDAGPRGVVAPPGPSGSPVTAALKDMSSTLPALRPAAPPLSETPTSSHSATGPPPPPAPRFIPSIAAAASYLGTQQRRHRHGGALPLIRPSRSTRHALTRAVPTIPGSWRSCLGSAAPSRRGQVWFPALGELQTDSYPSTAASSTSYPIPSMQCFFPAEVIKSIRTPTFILNSAYDSWQVQNVVVPDSSSPDESWRRRRADIRSCNSSQIQVLNGFRKAMVDGLKAVGVNKSCSWFIDSCFIHCQAWFDNSLQ